MADPDLQIRGGGPFGPQFGLKISGYPGPRSPSPESTTVIDFWNLCKLLGSYWYRGFFGTRASKASLYKEQPSLTGNIASVKKYLLYVRFHCRHLLRFHCCHSLRFHCCHWLKFLHPSQSSSRSPSRDIWKRSHDYDWYLLSVASKRVHVTKKHVIIGWKQDMFCCQTVEVWGGVRQTFTCKVGSCLST